MLKAFALNAITELDTILNAQVQYLPLKNGNAVLAADTMRNLRREALVVHQQELELANVVDNELLEPIGKKVASLLVRAVPNLCPRIS
jgi:hypothetical protein